MRIERRKVIKKMGAGLIGYGLLGSMPILNSCSSNSTESKETTKGEVTPEADMTADLFFNISLAQWSLHKSFFGSILDKGFEALFAALQSDPDSALQGEIDPLNFPIIAKQEYGIDTVELVNTFYFSKAQNMEYLKDLKSRAEGEGVKISLIMCDMLGDLGEADATKRKQSVENHYPWIEAVKFLGGQTIRVNAAGVGTAEEVKTNAAEGLSALSAYAKQGGINVVVENHGGYSSDGKWLSSLMEMVNLPNCGTLPDFGNFCIEREGFSRDCKKEYDRYLGMKEIMPFAKGVSAKTHEFDIDGNEVHSDFSKMLKIVKDVGFTGNIGIEYEGMQLSEKDGILATKKLLERVGSRFTF